MNDIDKLTKNAVDVIDKAELKARLDEGRPLRIKAGFDPSAPDIHLGHTVLLRKLRQFQDAGHKVIFIVGDMTATIGDPTGQSKTRPVLTKEQVIANAKTYQEQAFKILDKDPAKIEVVFNSKWLDTPEMLVTFLKIAGQVTVDQLLVREDFDKRRKAHKPIALQEMMYPIMQGYDSVVVKADVELGGTDQLFNLLMGRQIQSQFGQRQQIVMTMPLLVGLDGAMKMSKSLGNYIGVNDPAKEMFGKAMSIPDELMPMYYDLLTDERMPSGHPMDAKKTLARLIASSYHGERAGQQELEEFERVFSRKETPDHPDELKVEEKEIWIVELLKRGGAAGSTSDAKRLIEQGAVSIDGERITDFNLKLPVKKGTIMKAGKKRFIKLVSLVLFIWTAAFSAILVCTAAETASSDILKNILDGKIAEIEMLVTDPMIVSTVERAVSERRSMTEKEILAMDSQWRASKPGDSFDEEVIKTFMTNDCALRLKEFQKKSGDYVEIFITGKRGLNICQTNKTSDFYQADEVWWTDTYAKGQGKSYAGKIEYDDSAHSESIPVYVPVRNAQGEVIGICKAVVDLAALADEL